jgi:hypothetical protein
MPAFAIKRITDYYYDYQVASPDDHSSSALETIWITAVHTVYLDQLYEVPCECLLAFAFLVLYFGTVVVCHYRMTTSGAESCGPDVATTIVVADRIVSPAVGSDETKHATTEIAQRV